jgi:hypothetical protein
MEAMFINKTVMMAVIVMVVAMVAGIKRGCIPA